MIKNTRKKPRKAEPDFESYFKIGVSPEFILIRQDFPMTKIAPGHFSHLIREMFQRNDEVLSHVK